jgi:hypothetical protein
LTTTTATPLTATFTKFNNDWCIKIDRKLTAEDFVAESRMVIGGSREMLPVCRVEVTLKSGGTKIVEVAEYETEINGEHIYSVR